MKTNYQQENLDSEKRKKLLEQAASDSIKYLDSLDSRRVSPSESELNELEKLNIPLQEEPIEPESVIKLLNEVGSKTTVANAGGRYFGFVIGGSHPVSVAANWLASAWDQNGGLEVTSPINAKIEEITSEWLKEIITCIQRFSCWICNRSNCSKLLWTCSSTTFSIKETRMEC